MVGGVCICSICIKQSNTHTKTEFLNIEVIERPYPDYDIDKSQISYLHYPKPETFSRAECACNLFDSLPLSQCRDLGWMVTEALAHAGLKSSNLIVGIDFTKSNEWTGARSFNRRSLHYIGSGLNLYEQAISSIGKTLAAFDEDNLISCYGFGDEFS
ncbi:E3 ubiquitin-protein ligase RGLG2 [Camellia lanceoleosa]|uniref:E3 ubiquitin-protein ligase RGLG2 n=1 Tax=Camellia lanceoleosa TaxID=1840588 RepID=A0ACC0HYW8_9ERIC|nr:E3 ubiquitin-protein ligase RGLG2 [Camellia lanceoleosa]